MAVSWSSGQGRPAFTLMDIEQTMARTSFGSLVLIEDSRLVVAAAGARPARRRMAVAAAEEEARVRWAQSSEPTFLQKVGSTTSIFGRAAIPSRSLSFDLGRREFRRRPALTACCSPGSKDAAWSATLGIGYPPGGDRSLGPSSAYRHWWRPAAPDQRRLDRRRPRRHSIAAGSASI